ncbi:MAG: DNA replication/repair protein RecF [Armatimonadetes bacterium JP3_11]|jgi:DNA replication and repair protein RecF|nr:MAG: DNA replication/repair protein RecF [Armatimonadetes bacterium CP1_7O]OYT71557.1 MAG: DNA replication/repair protein RecF [Armatimonadetes bacterium JP3_11]RMH10841.1 MAG: DNA replication/repair protein RecF [Armatimonadota bacterium]
MRLHALRLWHFRNYERAQIEPSPRVNILLGANAQGKTNLLEAIYYLSALRPLRPVRELDLIQWNAPEMRLYAHYEIDGLTDELHLRLPAQGKRVMTLNEQPVSKQSALVGKLSVVCFTAQDLTLVRGEPADRRRFLDSEISLLSHRYLYALAHYKRALEQRNNLLRGYLEGVATLESLPEWNAQLVKYGARLFHARKQFLERLNALAQTTHRALTHDTETLTLQYLPGLPLREPLPEKEEDWSDALMSALHQSAGEELRRGTTLYGPHRDDFRILLQGYEARLYASQGQQRTCALSLRLSEVALVESVRGEPPIVLLDDVFSDLDPTRRRHLVEFLTPRTQTFVTCTDLSAFDESTLRNAALFEVHAGTVSRHA